VTINVTENPVGIPQTWSIPSGSAGVPMGQLVFANQNVEIGPATSEVVAVSINGQLPIGYAYRLMDAYVDLKGPVHNDVDQYTRQAQLQLLAYNPTSPSQTIIIRSALSAGNLGIVNTESDPNVVDASATPNTLIYAATNPPRVPLTALHPTTVFNINLGATSNTTTGTVKMGYYVRFLFYSIDENELYAIHTPELVV
jgi:hypothetical protein